MKKLSLCIFLLFLAGCTIKSPLSPKMVFNEDIDAKWNQIVTNPIVPMNIEGSLRFGEKNNTSRVTFFLWRNALLPIRLDIFAANTLAGKIIENKEGILIYLTQDNVAYTHEDSSMAFRLFGIDFPLNLEVIAGIIQGDFPLSQLEYQEYTVLENNFVRYLVSRDTDPLYYGEWTLDERNRPVAWVFSEWAMDIEYKEDNPFMPYKISGKSLNQQEFTLLVRARTDVTSNTKQEMGFQLPAQANVVPLTIYE